jgi:hypothetical protein
MLLCSSVFLPNKIVLASGRFYLRKTKPPTISDGWIPVGADVGQNAHYVRAIKVLRRRPHYCVHALHTKCFLSTQGKQDKALLSQYFKGSNTPFFKLPSYRRKQNWRISERPKFIKRKGITWPYWQCIMHGKIISSLQPGATITSYKCALSNVPKMFANSCWASWIGEFCSRFLRFYALVSSISKALSYQMERFYILSLF